MHKVHSAPCLTGKSEYAGTIMGVSRYLKEKNPDIQIVGLQPAEGASIAGIRRWPKEYLPKIFQVGTPCKISSRNHLETLDGAVAGSERRKREVIHNDCWTQEERVDRVMEIGQREAEETMRALAKVEGIFAGGANIAVP